MFFRFNESGPEPEVWLLSGLCAIIRGLDDVHWPGVCCCSAVTSCAQVCVCMMSGVCDELMMAREGCVTGLTVCIFVFSVCVAMQPVNSQLYMRFESRCS